MYENFFFFIAAHLKYLQYIYVH